MSSSVPESARHAERLGHGSAGASMQLASQIWRVSSLLTKRMSASAEVADLQLGEAEVLMATRVRGDAATTPGDLRTQLNLTSAGITKRIDMVEARRLIERRPNPDDRRSVTLHLTPAGEELADEVIKAVATAIEDVTATALTDVELADTNRMMAKLGDVLDAE